MIRTALLVMLACALVAPVALSQEDDVDKKGKLAIIKDKLITLEKTHRHNLNQIHELISDAAGDSKLVAKLKKGLKKERERFRAEAADLQEKLRRQVDNAGLNEVLAKKKKATKQLEGKLRSLRIELNQARQSIDTKKIEEIKKKMEKIEKEFVEQLKKALAEIKAKSVDSD